MFAQVNLGFKNQDELKREIKTEDDSKSEWDIVQLHKHKRNSNGRKKRGCW